MAVLNFYGLSVGASEAVVCHHVRQGPLHPPLDHSQKKEGLLFLGTPSFIGDTKDGPCLHRLAIRLLPTLTVEPLVSPTVTVCN